MSSPSDPTARPRDWRWDDWMDWEYSVARLPEPLEDHDWVAERRAMGLDQAEKLDDSPEARSRWLGKWLDLQREKLATTPGKILRTVAAGFAFFAGLLGLLSGWGAAAATLRPRGLLADGSPEPVNVLLYLLVCVAPPFLFSLFSLSLFLFSLPKGLKPPGWLAARLGGVMESLWSRLALRRKGLGDEWRRLRVAMRNRAGVWQWSALAAFQCFGLMFTVAVFLNSFFTITVTDRSFGWQTSWTQAGTQPMHLFAKTAALPWEAFAGKTAHPTLEEVRLSQIKPMSHQTYDENALKSWWPFLLWCDAVYGIFPRVFLLALTAWLSRRALRREGLEDPRSDRVWRLLARPVMRTRIREDKMVEPEPPPPRQVLAEKKIGRDAVLWVARKGGPEDAVWAEFLREEFGWDLVGVTEDWGEIHARLAESENRALVIGEASYMAPVRSLRMALEKARGKSGGKRRALIALFGRDGPPSEQEMSVWRQRTLEWGDPWLAVEAMGRQRAA